MALRARGAVVVVPPAPMFLAGAELDWTVGTVDSLAPAAGAIRAADLHERGLIARTAMSCSQRI